MLPLNIDTICSILPALWQDERTYECIHNWNRFFFILMFHMPLCKRLNPLCLLNCHGHAVWFTSLCRMYLIEMCNIFMNNVSMHYRQSKYVNTFFILTWKKNYKNIKMSCLKNFSGLITWHEHWEWTMMFKSVFAIWK